MSSSSSEQPKSIAVFGASGRIGGPLARHVAFAAPDVALRMITSSPAKRETLRAQFPDVDCVVGDFFDPHSLQLAVKGMECVFVVTPSPFDEAPAMANLVRTIQQTGDAKHIVRLVGFEPETLARRIPEHVRRFGGTALQHHVAKDVLDDSDLPVTYLNIGASYMDNFLALAGPVKASATLIWPERLIPYIDPRDVGEIAANILLSADRRHLHQFHTVNNGADLLTTQQVGNILSDVLKRPLTYQLSREAFIAAYGPTLAASRGVPNAAEGILDFLEYEQGNSAFMTLNDFAERILGRKPTTVRAWFMEHRHHFQPN